MEFRPIREDTVSSGERRGRIAEFTSVSDGPVGRVLAIVVWDDAETQDAPQLMPMHKLRKPTPDVTETAPFRINWTVTE